MKFLKSSTGGFSLVEVMVGMVILGIGMCGLAGMGTLTVKANAIGMKTTTASTLAQERMEYVKGLKYSQLGAAGTTEAYGNISNYNTFKRVTTVTPDATNPDVATVTVEVFWNNDANVVSLQTIITNNGV
jgi:type IV pilus assembly protein PilV